MTEPQGRAGEELQRSEQLIDEARAAAQDATPEIDGEPDAETSGGDRYPRPGDESDAAERF